MSDKPIECSGCQKKCSILFKRVFKGEQIVHSMCEECPLLKEKLFSDKEVKQDPELESQTELICSECHCELKHMMQQKHTGCSSCYSLFDRWIVSMLKMAQKIPQKLLALVQGEQKMQLHIGRGPNDRIKEGEISKLDELNKHLDAAVSSENFEQAALLRDQIMKLKQKAYESKGQAQ